MLFDWHEFHAQEAAVPVVVDSRRRLGICLAAFVAALLVVFLRAVQLEVTQGSAFRAEAVRPLERERMPAGVRGRILGRDGTVLAYDKRVLALAMAYRYLEQPPNADWLRRLAGQRLSAAECRDPQRLAAEEARLRSEHTELARRLTQLCGMTMDDWQRRARRVQGRVERIAAAVSQQHATDTPVAEELDYHVMVDDVPLGVVAEIEGHPRRYPGVKILGRSRRAYPAGGLAAHVLGHLGPVDKQELADKEAGYHAEDFVGRSGVERRYESLLRGRRGLVVELTDHSGVEVATDWRRKPGVGRDLVLTLDPQLQHAAETLLDSALERQAMQHAAAGPCGGAIVVMDVNTGALLVAASAPRYDPNLFVGGSRGELADLLADQSHPLFDRVCQMTIPPGSVFKTVTAAALLQAAAVDPAEPFFCQGYLYQPDRQRCDIFRRHGVGHGEVTLADALAVSCNVYFFHYGEKLGPGPLVGWAGAFGFGQPTGVDLPGEASGEVPTPATIRGLEGHQWRPGDTCSLAIGQGRLTATPLQVARMMAAIANGGRLVTPHVVSRLGLPELADGQLPKEELYKSVQFPPAELIPGLRPETLAAIGEGLKRVVADPKGTAHGTVCMETVAIAGKTGTAQTGADRAAHAWFAGYAPAERPKLAFVVVLEHAGTAATAAGPVAKRLVLRMKQLGLL
jgi:penicillin-binding protein 2